MQSKTTVFPCFIASTKNPGINFKISLLFDLSFFGQGFVCPIKSEHCKFFVHKHKQFSFFSFICSLFIILLKHSAHHLATCVIPLSFSPTIIACLSFVKENNTEETVSHKLSFL